VTGGSPRLGLLIGVVGVVAVALGLRLFSADVAKSVPALAFLVPVGMASFVGGRRVAIASALAAAVAYDSLFVPPTGSLRVGLLQDTVALVLFITVALGTGSLVAFESHRRRAAQQRVQELADLHSHLQAAVAERDRLEEETRRIAVLEEVDRQRAALLRAVSHDLRTPLGTIRAVVSDLRAGTSFDVETKEKLMDLVLRESERLDRIVTNLLSLSRIEAGALQPEVYPVDLSDVVDAAIERLASVLAHCVVRVEIGADVPPVVVDFTQMDLVFTNLLDNAARHTPPDSAVTVTAATSGTWVTVEIRDEGPGVDPSLGESVFDAFRSGRGSTGIGLAIARSIVEAHGGSVRLGGTERPGGRFIVHLPLTR
jgi:K+-sensing histidine kinase KdpD